ncbi:MAG TPA: MarR family transcriptional regulator [Candidatus Dormibacteraeota bacterium]|nr:MarR family transcriptional regulator [Candidatus Dormibacteraeota bacterium]
MATGRNEPYTQSLLLAAYQETASVLLAALRRAGHTSIRHKHGAVFANLDAEGTRPSVLAERAGMTKAAVGELVDELERLGYVQRRPDPSDRRAKLIVPTAAAHDVVRVVRAVNEEIERRFRDRLGEEAYATLRGALMAIVPRERIRLQPRIVPGGQGAGRERGLPAQDGGPAEPAGVR